MTILKQVFAAAMAVSMLAGSVQANTIDKLEGVWQAVGYGRILEIKDGAAQTYHITGISCQKGWGYTAEQAKQAINRIDVTEKGKMSFYTDAGITRYDYTALPALPDNCTDTENHDPEYNFEVFWHAFNDNYAFFELRGVNWDAAYKKYRPQVTKNTTPEELFKIFSDMQASLQDQHVSLETPLGEFYSGAKGTLEKFFDALPEDKSRDFDETMKSVIARHYLKGSKKTALKRDNFTWGWAAEGIGYLSVDGMGAGIEGDYTGFKTRDLVDDTMDRILTDLDGAKGLIVDMRWNGGGWDEFGLAIAGHLTDKNLMALTKRPRVGDGFAPKQQVFIPTHARKKFTGPIAFLQGTDSYSATEIFAMAMEAIPTVTSIGETTPGILSDVLGFPLPNGWEIGMSNELYIAIDGSSYEGTGIPVEIGVPVKESDTLESYLKRGTDRAIKFLRDQ